MDDTAGIVVSNLYVTTSAAEPVELKIVSAEISSTKGAEFEFTVGASITVGANATLVLNTDMGGSWTSQNLPKYGAGTVVFDLAFRTPQTSRPLIIKEGRAVVLATSQDPRFLVRLDGSDPANPPVFENRRDNGLYGNLDAPGLGAMQLNGTAMKVGDLSNNSVTTNTIPAVADSGTLSFQNERIALLAETSPNYALELDRADVLYAPKTVVRMLFDDDSNPAKDDVGSGSRLVSIGSPAIADDAVRGSVLSLDGSSGFKGPDADYGLEGFDPAHGFTLSLWLKPASDCSDTGRVFFFGENQNYHAVALRLHNHAETNLFFSVWGTGFPIPVTGIKDGNWHHVAVTFNGKPNYTSYKFYYDGRLVLEKSPWHTCAQPNKNFYIGNVQYSAWSGVYKGLLDDFFLSSRVLSFQEIRDIYSNGLSAYGGSPSLNAVTAKSAGTLSVEGSASIETLSGAALAGGVELAKPDATLTVGTGAGAVATSFKGVVAGTDSTLAKAGADYTLTLSGSAKGVTNVVVDAGTLQLRRPRTRQGLVCYYSFDDPTDFGHDDGPGGFHLSNLDTGTPTSVAGVKGKAIHFGGTADPVVLGSGAHPMPEVFPRGNESFTVSAWIRPTEASCTGQTCVFTWGKAESGRVSLLRFDTANSFYWHFNGNAYQLQAICPVALGNGDWHHIVATYDAETRTKTIYCDGAYVNSMTVPAANAVNIDPTYRFEIGRYVQSDAQKARRYEGDMDEFMVFDYAWTADEVLAEYNGTASSANVAATTALPTPVARWTFDGEDPLADTTGNAALHLTETSTNDTYNVTFVSGDAICGKAAKFAPSSGSGFLKLDTFPSDIIPSGDTTFTAIARYRPGTTQVKNGALSVVGWGTAADYDKGKLFRIGPYQDNNQSARFVRSDGNGVYPDNGTYCSSLGNDRTRWYTVAVVYRPSVNGAPGVYNFYVDGEFIKSGAQKSYSITAESFAIGAGYEGTKAFTGLIDDVQIYDCALSDGQIRMIAEQFEASKGKATTGSVVPAGVFADQPDVTVASGATLKVASVETVGNLSGAGAVELLPFARLNVASSDGFSGTVTGAGALGFADGAALDIGDGSAPLLNVDAAVALGANVNVTTTARSGRLLIAHATSFVGAENLDSWTATTPGDRAYRFVVADAAGGGKNLYLVIQSGLMIILR